MGRSVGGRRMSDKHVLCGGSFSSNDLSLRTIHRGRNVPITKQDNYGCRLVCAPRPSDPLVLRGGSIFDTKLFLCAASSDRSAPGLRFVDLGCRLVCAERNGK